MRTALDNLTHMHYNDLVAVLNTGQSVGDDDGCSIGTNCFQIIHNVNLGFTVQRRSRLVAQENRSVF